MTKSTTMSLMGCGSVMLACAALSACGFHSVYGGHGADGSPVADQLNSVAIDPIPDRPGQLLRNDLIDTMYVKGRPMQPQYHLTVKLRTAEESLGTLANATSTRSALHAYGDYSLKDLSGKELTKGSVQSTTTYDLLNSMYSTQVSHDSAIERTVNEVGQQITNRVGLYFSEQQPTAP
jgi:LPS-assembly lipoprotein